MSLINKFEKKTTNPPERAAASLRPPAGPRGGKKKARILIAVPAHRQRGQGRRLYGPFATNRRAPPAPLIRQLTHLPQVAYRFRALKFCYI